MTWVKHGVRFFLVTVGIIVLTSLGIDASQYLSGSSSALGILADRATEGVCPAGMVFVERGTDDFCIDKFEVATSDQCVHSDPRHFTQTSENIQNRDCSPVSTEDSPPWVHVTYHQARELCAQAGKRLPTNSEWYAAALGTHEQDCNIDSSDISSNDSKSACVSSVGALNMIGNTWEWVDGAIADGIYEDRQLPETGYVSNADSSGVALETQDSAQSIFHNDYFWSLESGSHVMMRGGFYSSGDDAGLYSVHADIEPNFSGPAVGFRCVMSV